MQNSNSKDGTKVLQSDAAEVPTSSQTIAKPNVRRSTSVKTAMQCHISRLKQLRDIYQIGTPQHNCFSIAINEAMVELVKEKKQIEFSFSEGFGCSCFSVDKSAEEYYLETFKQGGQKLKTMWKYFWIKIEQEVNPYEIKFQSETGEETFIAVTNDIKSAEFIVAACTQFALDYEDDEEK